MPIICMDPQSFARVRFILSPPPHSLTLSLYYPEKSPHPLINDHRNSYDWAELIVYLYRYTRTRVGLAIIFAMGTNNKNDKKEYYDIDCAVLRLDRVSGRERG